MRRVVYELACGEELGKLVVTARCRNPLCVNLSHLIAVRNGSAQVRRDRPNRNNKTSLVRGVSRDRCGRWRAYLSRGTKQVNLGSFDSIAEAEQAVRKARARIAA